MRRILLKLSGEALGGKEGKGLDAEAIVAFGKIIADLSRTLEIAIVTGGGNMMRGANAPGIDRCLADQIGMTATVMNCMALAAAIRHAGAKAEALSAVPSLAKPYNIFDARRMLSEGTVVLVAGGTTNPYFSTDSASALRALELAADIMVKSTKVDGIYDKDPQKYADAKRYDEISLSEALDKKLGVLDLTAMALCMAHGLDIRVCNVADLADLSAIIDGKNDKSSLLKA